MTYENWVGFEGSTYDSDSKSEESKSVNFTEPVQSGNTESRSQLFKQILDQGQSVESLIAAMQSSVADKEYFGALGLVDNSDLTKKQVIDSHRNLIELCASKYQGYKRTDDVIKYANIAKTGILKIISNRRSGFGALFNPDDQGNDWEVDDEGVEFEELGLVVVDCNVSKVPSVNYRQLTPASPATNLGPGSDNGKVNYGLAEHTRYDFVHREGEGGSVDPNLGLMPSSSKVGNDLSMRTDGSGEEFQGYNGLDVNPDFHGDVGVRSGSQDNFATEASQSIKCWSSISKYFEKCFPGNSVRNASLCNSRGCVSNR